MDSPILFIKGAGDLASGVALRLYHSGFHRLVISDLPFPTAIRRTVSFCPAVLHETALVEDVLGRFCVNTTQIEDCWNRREIPLIIDAPLISSVKSQAAAVIDAVIAKHNTGTALTDAPFVVGLGPGFTVGTDCHAIIETNRGHHLGRVIYHGCAEPDTGIPGNIGGYTSERILRTPARGIFTPLKEIGAQVSAGETVGMVENIPMKSQIDGVLRGILPKDCPVDKGFKAGDVDPRAKKEHCFSVSDKSRAIGGGVLEALLHQGIRP